MVTLEGDRIGLALPQIHVDGRVDRRQIHDVATHAEDLGVGSLWVQEQLMGRTSVLDSLTLLAHVSAITTTIGLGVSVLGVPQHSPLQLAKRLSTIDQLSGGRLTVGVGIGSAALTPDVGGMATSQLGRRLDEGVEVMRALWTADEATVDGAFWQLQDIPMNPKPVQRPHPTLWFGGRHPNALRRAVTTGDGWVGAGASPLDQFREHVHAIDRLLDDEGRGRDDFTIAKRLYVAIDDGNGDTRATFANWFGAYYRDPAMATRVGVCGSAAQVREAIESVHGMGADVVIVNPVHDHGRHLQALQGFLQEP